MYDRILTAFDATPNAAAVLEHSRRLAELTGARVFVLHVLTRYRVPDGLSEGAPPAGVPSTEAEHGIDARQLVDQAVAQLVAAGITAEAEMLDVPEETAAQVILERARQWEAELIVLGARQHGGLARLWRPSVADQVVHHPPCPILVVP